MAQTVQEQSHSAVYTGGAAGDNAVVIESGDVQRFNTFSLLAEEGTVDVYVSLGNDGSGNPVYSAVALSLVDRGATASAPVNEALPTRVYGFRGVFKKIKVLQKGGTAVVGCRLTCGSM